MIKNIDIFKIEKEISDYKDEFMETFIEFKSKAKEWADNKNYTEDKYILYPTLTWTKEKPFILKYTLEIRKYVKEE